MNDKFKIFSCNELKIIEQENYNAIMKYANSEGLTDFLSVTEATR